MAPNYEVHDNIRLFDGRIRLSRGFLTDFCRRYHVQRLSFFGSVLRDDFRHDSDVDVLVEFDGSQPVGFFTIARMEQELTAALGRPVDVRTPAGLSRYFREEVLRTAQLAHGQ
jgi:uncharacterized protein